MKTIQNTLQRISDLTATIESNYPELYVLLEKDPLLPADSGQPTDLKSFAPYLEDLHTQLEEQLARHKNRKPKRLPNLAGEVNYNQEKVQSMLISGKECQKTYLYALTKGQRLKTNEFPEDVILIVLEGHCSITLGQTEQQLQPGEIIRLPANVPHSVQAITYFKMILLK